MLGLMEETTRGIDLPYEHQKLVLVELVVDPFAEGDPLPALAERLGLRTQDAEAAVAALEEVGLAQRDGALVSATPAARHFERLSPVLL